jgi:hypothetical protein
MTLMAKPAAAAPPVLTASSTPGGKMMARGSIIIGHGITLRDLGVLSREIRLILREGLIRMPM